MSLWYATLVVLVTIALVIVSLWTFAVVVGRYLQRDLDRREMWRERG